jgi:hypothetical protein
MLRISEKVVEEVNSYYIDCYLCKQVKYFIIMHYRRVIYNQVDC